MSFKSGPAARLLRRRRKRIVAPLIASILLAIGFPAFFLFPSSTPPMPSDAVLVLAGVSDGRHQLGAELIGEGISQNFVVSNPLGPHDKVGHAYCQGRDLLEGASRVWCMRPIPVTTVGEAMTIGKLAEEEGWTTLTAVTNRPHTRRVQTIFEQCTNLDVDVVSISRIDVSWLPYHLAQEIGGYIKFWITNPCGDMPKS